MVLSESILISLLKSVNQFMSFSVTLRSKNPHSFPWYEGPRGLTCASLLHAAALAGSPTWSLLAKVFMWQLLLLISGGAALSEAGHPPPLQSSSFTHSGFELSCITRSCAFICLCLMEMSFHSQMSGQ